MNTYHIATIPGDGIGKEVIPETVKVLETLATKCGFQLKFAYYNYSCEYYKSHGKMMPDDGLERLRDSEGDIDFVSTRGNSVPFDGVFWLEQIRTKEPTKSFIKARKNDSAEMPLSKQF
jgi:hypothetical protein